MERKRRKHFFFDRFTIPGALLLFVIGLFGSLIPGSLLAVFVEPVVGDQHIATNICSVLMAFVVLGVYKFWFRPEFEGNLRGGDLKTGMKLFLIMVVYWAFAVPVGFIAGYDTFGAPTAWTVCEALAAGICEEVAFRGLPLSYLMRQWKKEKQIPVSVLFTAAVFGLVHLVNISGGTDPRREIFQVIGAFCGGIFDGVVYLRSGSLIIPMISHTIHDILAFLNVSGVVDGIIVSEINWTNYYNTVIQIALAAVGMWLIRPSKRAEIREMWNRKWNIDQ